MGRPLEAQPSTSLRRCNDNAGHFTSSDPTYGALLSRFSGHLDTPTKTYTDAFGRDIAVEEMVERARKLGGNAVIGVDVDYETVGGTMVMVSVSGTAIKVD